MRLFPSVFGARLARNAPLLLVLALGLSAACAVDTGDEIAAPGGDAGDDGRTGGGDALSDGADDADEDGDGGGDAADATPDAPTCGDGALNGEEECDGDALGGASCISLGFGAGELACGDDCTFDTGGCPPPPPDCGDGVVEGEEECDGESFSDLTCEDFDFTFGVLRCTPGCTVDTSRCNDVPVCGDELVDGDEECDDGNAVSGDGCSADCVVESCGDGIVQAALGEECELGNSELVDCEGDALGLATCLDDCTLSEAICPDATLCGNGSIDIGESCDDGNTDDGDGCSASCRSESCGDGERSEAEVCDDTDLGGLDCAEFGFEAGELRCDACALDFSDCRAILCGDGLVDGDEECDDGNNDSGDGCDATCHAEVCGDGVRQAERGEQCDGADVAGFTCATFGFEPGPIECTDRCRFDASGCVPRDGCGDGDLAPEDGEECDDGNTSNGDGCSAGCRLELCGDGLIQEGLREECEPGAFLGAPCTDFGFDAGAVGCADDCTFDVEECRDFECGDGVIEGEEECDDGNEETGDGCSDECVAEVCGDGIVHEALGEECDDGNVEAGDGCTPECVAEICGDGILHEALGEACDDGEDNADDIPDACRTDCSLAACGDGTVDGDEACDDGEDNADDVPDACRTDCTLPTCGDDTIDDGEACDDGEDNADDVPDACRTDCTLASCGDGTVDDGEECDDGNSESGDGCDGFCVEEVCGDGVLQEALGEECDDGNLEPGDGCDDSCIEEVCGDGVLQEALGEECDDGNLEPGDGCDDSCIEEFCGDGVLQEGLGEQCDDGGNEPGDGCDAVCIAEVCGDGIVQEGLGEECDDGNGESGDGCDASCIDEFCGDGLTQPGLGEECDDANADDTDACLTTCLEASCGDGLVHAGVEACDDGNDIDTDDCTNECEIAACGDGIVREGEEACDDGNDVDTDACTNECQEAICGDGIVQDGVEECDDGNTDDADGCLTTCVEARCGDNVVREGIEECDDGNDVSGDGCDSTCTEEFCGDGVVQEGLGEECDQGEANSDEAPNACRSNCSAPSCGDGVVDTGEACDEGDANSDDRDSSCLTTCEVNPRTLCGDKPEYYLLPEDGFVTRDGRVRWEGTLDGARNDFIPEACELDLSTGGDAVFRFVAPLAGTYEVTTDLPGNGNSYTSLSVQTSCDALSAVACDALQGFGGVTHFVDLEADEEVFFVVDQLEGTPRDLLGAPLAIEIREVTISAEGEPCKPAVCADGLRCTTLDGDEGAECRPDTAPSLESITLDWVDENTIEHVMQGTDSNRDVEQFALTYHLGFGDPITFNFAPNRLVWSGDSYSATLYVEGFGVLQGETTPSLDVQAIDAVGNRSPTVSADVPDFTTPAIVSTGGTCDPQQRDSVCVESTCRIDFDAGATATCGSAARPVVTAVQPIRAGQSAFRVLISVSDENADVASLAISVRDGEGAELLTTSLTLGAQSLGTAFFASDDEPLAGVPDELRAPPIETFLNELKRELGAVEITVTATDATGLTSAPMTVDLVYPLLAIEGESCDPLGEDRECVVGTSCVSGAFHDPYTCVVDRAPELLRVESRSITLDETFSAGIDIVGRDVNSDPDALHAVFFDASGRAVGTTADSGFRGGVGGTFFRPDFSSRYAFTSGIDDLSSYGDIGTAESRMTRVAVFLVDDNDSQPVVFMVDSMLDGSDDVVGAPCSQTGLENHCDERSGLACGLSDECEEAAPPALSDAVVDRTSANELTVQLEATDENGDILTCAYVLRDEAGDTIPSTAKFCAEHESFLGRATVSGTSGVATVRGLAEASGATAIEFVLIDAAGMTSERLTVPLPAPPEICDGVDNDGDGLVDDADDDLVANSWARDLDGDGWSAAAGTVSCLPPAAEETACPAVGEPCVGTPIATSCIDRFGTLVCIEGELAPECDTDSDCPSPLSCIELDGVRHCGATATIEGTGTGRWVSRDGDCNEDNPEINPGADEICDFVDNDCDGLVDDADDALVADTLYDDRDFDGFGRPGTGAVRCDLSERPFPIVANGDDCNDDDEAINPDAVEICDDGIDQNCDGEPDTTSGYFWDADFDGFGSDDLIALSCTGTPANGVSGESYVACNEVGGPCGYDGMGTCVSYVAFASSLPLEPASGESSTRYTCAYESEDGGELAYCETSETCGNDALGNALTCEVVDAFETFQGSACGRPADLGQWVTTAGDCSPGDADVYPGAPERCNGSDDNCDGRADETEAAPTFYPDADFDGFGDASDPGTQGCGLSPDLVEDNTDCDDANDLVNPAQDEICGDGLDNDCSGGDGTELRYYPDNDGDLFGRPDPDPFIDAPATSVLACEPPPGGGCVETFGSSCSAGGFEGDCGLDGNDLWECTLNGVGCFDASECPDGFACVGADEGSGLTGDCVGRGFDYVTNDQDCNDDFSEINPEGTQECSGELASFDGDCDGFASDEDPECATPELCDNERDDDLDGLADCADPDCAGEPACPLPETCYDELDNDRDGLADCADEADCSDAPICAGCGVIQPSSTVGTDCTGDPQLCDADSVCVSTDGVAFECLQLCVPDLCTEICGVDSCFALTEEGGDPATAEDGTPLGACVGSP